MKYTVLDKFLDYVKFDTQADPTSDTFPSSSKQLILSKHICGELDALGIHYTTNEAGYIYATLPSNVSKPTPTIFFCAHLDTAPDCSGTDVKPIVHHNYQGQDIILPDDITQIISTKQYPILANKIGNDIVTASGLTLLGSDDKSGVAIIMDSLYQMVHDPSLPHGEVKALLTTDEEIGKGVAKVDLTVLNADFGYTLDSGDLGWFEDENFSADSLTLHIRGVSAHPGYAQGTMEHSIKIAAEVVGRLPKLTLTPESTNKKQGFIHPNNIEGGLEQTTVSFILRDFETEKLTEYKNIIQHITEEVLLNYPSSTFEIKVKNQYRNMKDVLDKHPHVAKIAVEAMKNVNITPVLGSIRGGTDGAVLSHLGVPCPNIFAGEQAIHSKHEWCSVQDMQKGVDTVIEIARLVSEMDKK